MTDDTTIVIFGATGDLTTRLLLPALAQLLTREPDRRVHLVGTGRQELTDDDWRARVRDALGDEHSDAVDALAEATVYLTADPTQSAGLVRILTEVSGRTVLYFALPPQITHEACELLAALDLPDDLFLAIEKPFGTDADSAHELNEVVRQLVPEDRIFRVDHFLGHSTVLNLLGIRFANRLFEPAWSAEHIESVTIRYDESLGVEGRAGYYDNEGALKDMIQSHLLQVMAIVAMEPPATLDERDLRDASAAALRATAVWGHDPVASSRRARYTAGEAGGEQLPSYADEPGVDASRGTETLAEATFEIATARWSGVPFTLRSGKALGRAVTEIVLSFRPVSHLPRGFSGEAPGAVLRFSLGPDEMALELNTNGGEDPFALERQTVHANLGEGALRAYAEVLSGILDGDSALSVRGDAAEQCWRIVQPVLDAWTRGDVPLDEYPAGTGGPASWPALP